MKTKKKMREIEIQVPAQSLNTWKQKYTIGDKAELHERFDRTKQVIANAFKGFATLTVIQEINTYYSK